jgi:hypothetical protein
LADEEGALEVDGDDGVPVGLRDVEELRGAEDAGVVDQPVHAAEDGERGGQGGLHVGAA